MLPLGELCEVNIGRTPSRDRREYWGPGSPWLSIADMNQGRELRATKETITTLAVQACNCRLAPAGTVLLSFKLSIGKVGIARVPLFTNEAIAALPIRASKTILADYLYWALQSIDLTLGLDRAAKGLTLNKTKLVEIKIPVPPLAEQRRIAEVLDRADGLRSRRRATLAQLDILTQSIFLDLFGDPLVNPKRWPDPTLGGLLTFQQYGPRFYNESYSAEGIRIVRITDLDEGGNLNFSEMPRLAVSDADRKKYSLRAGDLIFARTGATVGKVALIGPEAPPCIAGAYFITMRFAKTVEPIYARTVLVAPSIRAIVAKLSRQAAQQNFSGPGLRKLPMPLPPLELQRDFAGRVAAVEKLKVSHRASLSRLNALCSVLQHRAFRGEL